MVNNFHVSVHYPSEPDGSYEAINWPEGAPLPRWGETFIDAEENGPDGAGVYMIVDTTWIYKERGALGPEVLYLIDLSEAGDG